MAPRRLAALFAVALLAAASGVVADHPQTREGVTVAFDHVKGNEWWVEVKVAANAPVDAVEARVVGQCAGAYTTLSGCGHRLALNQWGVWAGSFHVPPGARVEFLAYQNGGMGSAWEQASCPFTHPAGMEQCPSGTATATTTATTTTGGGFEPAFTGFRGNEWWVQASVGTTSHCISKVDVRSNNGAWMPLAKQSWGLTAWAASYHFPHGSVLQMRATSCSGQVDLSSCRQWIPPSGQDAALVACPGATTTTSPQPSLFDATFSGVKGNEWWVQANVAANQPLKGVAVRVDCAPSWTLLSKQSWGGWAASFHIPAGSKVDFQARSTTGASDASGGYTWPAASAASGCPQGNWPRYGSFVEYELAHDVCGSGNCHSTDVTLRMAYRDDNSAGAWQGTCVGTDTFTGADGSFRRETWTSTAGFEPSHLPTRTQVGAVHQPMVFHTIYGTHSCGAARMTSPATVVRQEDHQVALRDADGNPRTLRTWYAESTNPSDNLHTLHWDTTMGLVQDWHSHPRRSGQGSQSMVLVDTDLRFG